MPTRARRGQHHDERDQPRRADAGQDRPRPPAHARDDDQPDEQRREARLRERQHQAAPQHGEDERA